MNIFRNTVVPGIGVLTVLLVQLSYTMPSSAAPQAPPGGTSPSSAPPPATGAAPRMGQLPVDATAANAARTIAPYFTPAKSIIKPPDPDGFLQRWLLLEPISKPNRSNTVFTDTYVSKTLNTEFFPDQFTVIPHDGELVTVAGQELAWHAVSFRLWPQQANVRRHLLGRHGYRQSARNPERSHGCRLKFCLNVVAQW
jgi:hypothetical protein